MLTLLARDDRPPRPPAPRLALAPAGDDHWAGWVRRGRSPWRKVCSATTQDGAWQALLSGSHGAHADLVVVPIDHNPNERRTSR